jgi:4-carboxymuconolactone decarboxylase
VLLQTAPYCGAPAALEAFRLAEQVLQETRQEAAAAG